MTIACCFRVIAGLQCRIAALLRVIASLLCPFARLILARGNCYFLLQPGTTTYQVVKSSNTGSNAPLLSCNAPLLRCNDRKSACKGHCSVTMPHCRLAPEQCPLQRTIAAGNRVIVSLQRRKYSQTRSVAAKQQVRAVLQHGGVEKPCILAVWRWAIVGMQLCIAAKQKGVMQIEQ